jgi:hypothetical protein
MVIARRDRSGTASSATDLVHTPKSAVRYLCNNKHLAKTYQLEFDGVASRHRLSGHESSRQALGYAASPQLRTIGIAVNCRITNNSRFVPITHCP